MRVAITGSTGLIGSALTRSLLADGHQVLRLTRGATAPAAAGDGSESAGWDPKAGTVQPGALDGVEAVVHLAGAGIGDKRWNDAYKRELRDSRVLGTETIARAVAELDVRPRVLVSSSAVGYYGPDRGDELLSEDSAPGAGFLAELVQDWEAATAPAAAAGIRVVQVRNGIVLLANAAAVPVVPG